MILENWLEWIARCCAEISAWELAAVVFAVIYVLLAVRQNRWCWVAAFISTIIFTALFWRVQLFMQSALNGYYIVMAVYGWWHWGGGGNAGELLISRWHAPSHALGLGLIAACALVSGYFLDLHSQAAWPYLDSLITWGAVITTFMMSRKVLDNWAYWMVINSAAIYLFVDREMLLTALLHVVYLVIAVFGWMSWYRDYKSQHEVVKT
jgi:nicotinamide mononucleotide transporter